MGTDDGKAVAVTSNGIGGCSAHLSAEPVDGALGITGG